MRLRAPSLALLVAALPAAHAQTPIVPTAVVKAQDFFTGPAIQVVAPVWVTAGDDRGWAASLDMVNVSSGALSGVIWGDLVDDGSTLPAVLRTTQTIAGRTQTRFGDVAVHGGSIAYSAIVLTSPTTGADSFWIDDDLQFVVGDPAPLPNATIASFGSVQLRAGGEASVVARVVDPGQPGTFLAALVDYPSGTVRIGPGTPVAGTTTTVEAVLDASVSPNGLHTAAIAVLTDARRALLLDGRIYAIDGIEIVAGGVIPGRAGGDGQLTWSSLRRVHVDDRGRVTFVGDLAAPWFPPDDVSFLVRDGSRMVGSPDVLEGSELTSIRTTPIVDPNGHVLCAWRSTAMASFGVDLVLDEQWVTRSGTIGVDVNGNGVPQSMWRLVPTPGGFTMHVAMSERGDAYMIHPIERGTDRRPALLRFRALPGTPSCAGQPNSTGFPSQLDTFGFDDAALNALTLRAFDLPRNTLGYFLVSDTSGFVPGAGGSAGDLCVVGSIGRYAGNVLSSGQLGVMTLPIDLTSIPQPMGTATAVAGDTWYFQLWHRDAISGSATSNFSPAIEITFD